MLRLNVAKLFLVSQPHSAVQLWLNLQNGREIRITHIIKMGFLKIQKKWFVKTVVTVIFALNFVFI